MTKIKKKIGIIICHGELAKGLFTAVREVFGENNFFHVFSNKDKSIELLHMEIKKSLQEYKDSSFFYFVDIRGGSCWRVAKQLAKETESTIFSGVNLPMLIEFLSKHCSDNYREEDVVYAIQEKAKQAIIKE